LNRVYIDTNVFVYAVGGKSRFRDPCREFLHAVVGRRVNGETSAYAVQEVAHQRRRRGDSNAAARARDVAAMCTVVHPTDREVVLGALGLIDDLHDLSVADAIHAATALAHRVPALVSADSDFDGIPGIERVDPLDGTRLAALMSG
jgi:predicted nucleic acid-binding protein